MSTNLYDILKCHQSNSTEQIIQEYKKLAKQFHPDKCNSEDAEYFKKIQYAKDILTDKKKREHYDHYLKYGSFMSLENWMENLERIQQSCHWTITKPQQSLKASKFKEEKDIDNCKPNLLTKPGSVWIRRHNNETINAFRNYKI
ncbi:DnaJ homolog subfamily C member 12 [Strongyloides ratti]|uniref:DnaJ homolog subfamily C member 12 n=1 Tax=Strongyloides ratti TaxID=34506 RepID=A0A090KQE2_STRRB|nr:DnaJ homolog subfamily C member 12 [Strongyloides ratti]CEF59609.1 DnaJ homolog subfamily C member 12 [Strongyloides ratti]